MTASSVDISLFKVPEPNPWMPWLIASIAALVILGTAVWIMQAIGLFNIPKDDPGAKTIAAAIALVGATLSAAVTLIGTVVKYSIDDRNARMAAVEAARNYRLAMDAEQRNRIDTAIRAVDLLSENNADATSAQIDGAVLALVNLGEHDLAVALLAQLWPNELVSPHVANLVLAAAIKVGSDDTQILASTVLAQNANRISHERDSVWPIFDFGWKIDLPGNARLALAFAASEWLKFELESNNKELPVAVFVLYRALDDDDEVVKEIAASSLWPIVEHFDEKHWLDSGHTRLTVAEVAERVRQHPSISKSNYGRRAASEIKKLLLKSASAAPHKSEPSDGKTKQE